MNPDAYRSADLVERDFSAGRPDKLWFADFTYLRKSAGSSQRTCAPISSSTHLRMALAQRGAGADFALVHHSDVPPEGLSGVGLSMGRLTDKETGLSVQRKYRSWTAQQKLEIVLAGMRGDRSVRDVCREPGIAETLS